MQQMFVHMHLSQPLPLLPISPEVKLYYQISFEYFRLQFLQSCLYIWLFGDKYDITFDIYKQPNKEEDGESYVLKFLPKVAQEIIDEFALRYAVEPIFRMMVYVGIIH